MYLSIKNEIKTEFAVKIYKKLHRKQTNEDFDFFIGLVERSTIVLRFYILNVVLPHNKNYVVELFLCTFNTAKALIFEFVCGVSRPFPWCKFSLC